jgi:hypothetical protein
MRLSTRDAEITATVKPITDLSMVRDIVERFRAKYGDADVRRYYAKFDVAVDVRLDS